MCRRLSINITFTVTGPVAGAQCTIRLLKHYNWSRKRGTVSRSSASSRELHNMAPADRTRIYKDDETH